MSKAAAVLTISFCLAVGGCSESADDAVSAKDAPKSVSASSRNEPLSDPSNPPVGANEPVAHEYASREGNVFYYADPDGNLIGVIDLGRLPRDQDFRRMLKKGDRAVQFDGRVFAAVSPGSDVVRVMEMRPGEQVFRPLQNVSLSSDAVAAKALRDSLAGHLTHPSAESLTASDADADANVAEEELGNAKADDYAEAQSEAGPPN